MEKHAFALFAIVALVYANALPAPFQFDDFNVIVDYPAVHSLRAWFDAQPGIRPLLKLSYALNWSLDARALGFHVFNLICHLVSAGLIFGLCRCWFASRSSAGAIALLAALLFALHPAQTEVVTYISGRSVGLMSVFYLGALLAANSAEARARNGFAPLLFSAALLIKETAWTLPLAALLVYRVREIPLREGLRRTRVLWLVLLVAATVMAAIPAYRRMLHHIFSIRSTFDNLLLQVDGWWYLLTRSLLLQTNIDPDLPLVPVLDGVWWLQAFVLLAVIAVALRTRSRWLQFALLWFFLHLLPTNSLLPRNDVANDRQLYLALIGPAALLAVSLVEWRRRYWREIVMAALVIVLAAATIARNRDYRSEIALWEATVRTSPGKARVWNNLGYAYQLAGRHESALAAYERALTLAPAYDRARINWHLLRDSVVPAHP